MTKDGPESVKKDPLYPRILLYPLIDGWIAEVEFSMEGISVATGPFDEAADALHDALLRMDKEASRENGEDNDG